MMMEGHTIGLLFCHPELVSGSPELLTLEMLKQVQHDKGVSLNYNTPSIVALNVSNGTAPEIWEPFTVFPLIVPMNEAGVPRTPKPSPSVWSFLILSVYLPESRQLLNVPAFNPNSPAYFLRSSICKALWLLNSLSCISQNLFWSLAQFAASAAFWACGWIWKSGKSRTMYCTLPVSIYSFLIFGNASLNNRSQNGHW